MPKCISYVSRGGVKLEHALNIFKINVNGKVVLDIGASTGGFTDCLLQHGAKRVYAVDVGYGQLAYKLQKDSRVVRMDKTNARYLTEADFTEKFDLITIDVSFISLEKILPAAKDLLKKSGFILALVKPNFEAGRGKTKKGIVRKKEIHIEVLNRLVEFVQGLRLFINGVTYSPIRGPKGNIEFFLYLRGETTNINILSDIIQVVDKAWNELIT